MQTQNNSMKKLLVILLVVAASSFVGKNEPTFNIKTINKNYVKINPDLYVSKFEVSNQEYRNFLFDLLTSNETAVYNQCLPDTLCWNEQVGDGERLTEYYFR